MFLFYCTNYSPLLLSSIHTNHLVKFVFVKPKKRLDKKIRTVEENIVNLGLTDTSCVSSHLGVNCSAATIARLMRTNSFATTKMGSLVSIMVGTLHFSHVLSSEQLLAECFYNWWRLYISHF